MRAPRSKVHRLKLRERRVIPESDLLNLSERDQVVLAQALLNPPRANRALREAARRYRTGR